jgi:hypothetical protein
MVRTTGALKLGSTLAALGAIVPRYLGGAMKTFLLAAVCSALLSGCASLMFEEHDPKVLLAQDQAACDGYGYHRGTDAYAQCLQLRDQGRQAHDDAARARISASLSQLSASLNAQSISNRPVTCMSNGNATRYGNSAYGSSMTTCY